MGSLPDGPPKQAASGKGSTSLRNNNNGFQSSEVNNAEEEKQSSVNTRSKRITKDSARAPPPSVSAMRNSQPDNEDSTVSAPFSKSWLQKMQICASLRFWHASSMALFNKAKLNQVAGS